MGNEYVIGARVSLTIQAEDEAEAKAKAQKILGAVDGWPSVEIEEWVGSL